MHNILLIAKETSSVSGLKKSLAGRGYRLINVRTIRDAVRHLKKDEIDLITIDSDCISTVRNSRTFRQLSRDIPRITLPGPDSIPVKGGPVGKRPSTARSGAVSMKDFPGLAGTLIRNKTLEKGHRRLESRLANRERELGFYDDIITTISAEDDIRKSVNRILTRTRSMTESAACALLCNDEPIFEILSLQRSKNISKFVFDKKVGISGLVLGKGNAVIVKDVSKDRRFNKKADTFAGLQITSLMCAPLVIKGRIVGVLRAANKKHGRPFTEDDMGLLTSAAKYTSIALERAFLYEKLKNDELTNLFNARHLNHAIEMEMERALRYNGTFSLIFMDIDDFKMINDRYGHLVGSRVLIETARILENNLRKVDVISRYGGDEFVMVLPQTPQDSSFLVAERLRRVIEKNKFLKHEGFSIKLTASLGVATFPYSARTKDELLEVADKAMYRGKYSTKNIVYSAI
jgi:diguanylate cyclase (GGDEF)-like protein